MASALARQQPTSPPSRSRPPPALAPPPPPWSPLPLLLWVPQPPPRGPWSPPLSAPLPGLLSLDGCRHLDFGLHRREGLRSIDEPIEMIIDPRAYEIE